MKELKPIKYSEGSTITIDLKRETEMLFHCWDYLNERHVCTWGHGVLFYKGNALFCGPLDAVEELHRVFKKVWRIGIPKIKEIF